ncbi:MAG: pyridoxal phosphate-dependent aminotransferase [Candidatus Hydrogenedentota bacterium]|nr:MAG: pyridoxal phosphate-dependent aminotransferase [Candidatus Hydrogenedentota bacterium]
MDYTFSEFSERVSKDSGIVRLMQDLDVGLSPGSKTFFLGGGNPAIIDEVLDAISEANHDLLDSPEEYARAFGIYDHPAGNVAFREVLADYFSRKFTALIRKENILITNGSQSSFFLLFHLFAGKFQNGIKQVLFPILPEYIGYHDLGLFPDMFTAMEGKVRPLQKHRFVYEIDKEKLMAMLQDHHHEIGLLALSRPSNPTSRVLEKKILDEISTVTKKYSIPVLIDNAYGYPFPGVIFTEGEYEWHENFILSFSLSKLGLPGLRTGIVVAEETVIERLSQMQGIFSLSPGGIGPALVKKIFEANKMDDLCLSHVLPYYREKSKIAQNVIDDLLAKTRYFLHESQGAFFLWLWLPDLKISAEELYKKCAAEGVIIVPGHYFAPKRTWPHLEQCIRISLARPDKELVVGLSLLCKIILENI